MSIRELPKEYMCILCNFVSRKKFDKCPACNDGETIVFKNKGAKWKKKIKHGKY